MSQWVAAWFVDWDASSLAGQIAKFMNEKLKGIHPIYIKTGIGKGDDSPNTGVVIYKNETHLPEHFPPIYDAPRWTQFTGPVSNLVDNLNNLDASEAVLAQFALTKTHGDSYEGFLFVPEGA